MTVAEPAKTVASRRIRIPMQTKSPPRWTELAKGSSIPKPARSRQAYPEMPVRRKTGEEAPAQVERGPHRLLEVLEMAARWYRHQLREEQGAAVRAYLEGRGFDAAAEGRRGFGYAPGEHGALSAALEGQGVTVDELMAAGLVGRRDEDGSTCDRFRDRLMFPIQDGGGAVHRLRRPGHERKRRGRDM